MKTYTPREQQIADNSRRDLASAYMNQVGEEWDDCCDQAERTWERCMERANQSVDAAAQYARDETYRYEDM